MRFPHFILMAFVAGATVFGLNAFARHRMGRFGYDGRAAAGCTDFFAPHAEGAHHRPGTPNAAPDPSRAAQAAPLAAPADSGLTLP